VVEVVVAIFLTAALTALLGGVFAPWLKAKIDRKSERFDSSCELVEILANGLWAYWKLALRVAYYGRKGDSGAKDYELALQQWDSDDAWQLGADIQMQVSRSKRLLPTPADQQKLDEAQRAVVDFLDAEIERLRHSGMPAEWQDLYDSLMNEKRAEIDCLLTDVTKNLKL
jgi:hypothetical protein